MGLFGIYAVVDAGLAAEPLSLLEAVLGGGVRVVQYRAKAGVDPALVRAMHARTASRGALLIVNDDLDAARDADGVHLGQEDLAAVGAGAVRERLGTGVFGVSCGTPDEARHAESLGADYVGVGPFAATGTKLDAGRPIGAAGVAAVVAATRLPVAAIGGIDATSLAAVAATGAVMAAVAGAIARAADPEAEARALVEAWARATGART